MRYSKPEPGEWVEPVVVDYRLGCCDCGLVHRVNFRLHEGRIQFQVFRDNRATGQKRRWRRLRGTAMVDWKAVAMTLLHYLVARDKCRIADVLRRAGVVASRIEIIVAYTEERRRADPGKGGDRGPDRGVSG